MKPSVAQIKCMSKEVLLELSDEWQISLEDGLNVRQLRSSIIDAMWSDEQDAMSEVGEKGNQGSLGSDSESLFEKLALRKLEL